MPDEGKVFYIDVEQVMLLHEQSIKLFGGSSGVRDMALVESAVNRPRMGYYDGVIEMAAALMESLLQNHPFVDGNKRTAFAATDVFLEANGYEIIFDSQTLIAKIYALFDTQSVTHENLVALLKEACQRR